MASLSGFFDGLSTLFEPVTKFATANPAVTAMMISGIAGIFEPSEYDKERDKLRAQEEVNAADRKRRNKNLEVGGLSLPEPASRATQFLNAPILQRRQPAMEDPIEQLRRQGLLQ